MIEYELTRAMKDYEALRVVSFKHVGMDQFNITNIVEIEISRVKNGSLSTSLLFAIEHAMKEKRSGVDKIELHFSE